MLGKSPSKRASDLCLSQLTDCRFFCARPQAYPDSTSLFCAGSDLGLVVLVSLLFVLPSFLLSLAVVPAVLEVGRIQIDGKMHVGWNRAHCG